MCSLGSGTHGEALCTEKVFANGEEVADGEALRRVPVEQMHDRPAATTL